MDFLKQNLSFLNRISPEFARMIENASDEEVSLVPASAQGLHLVVEGKPFNSRVDPLKEAHRAAEKQNFSGQGLIILGGLELGYTLKNLMEKYPEIPVLAVEKRASILKAAFRATDFTPFFSSGRLEILIPETPAMLFEFLKSYSTRKMALVFHRPAFDLDPNFYREVRETVERYVSTQEINRATLARFEKLWFKNLLLNLPSYLFYQGVEKLFGNFKDRPVFLIGAGPSLQKQIPLLKEIQNRFLLMAVNTSLPYLLEKGIVPHLVVTVDPQDKVYRYFLPVMRQKLSRIPVLIAEPTICPKIVKNYPGPVLFCRAGFLEGWLDSFSEPKGELDMGGSVITAAFSLARQMEAAPIVFLGTDMSYTEKTLHFRGAELEKEWLYSQTRTDSLEAKNYFFLKKTKLFPHEGFYGETVYTDMRFITYINWLEKNFRLFPELKVINATEGGIRFQHIEHESLKTVVSRYADSENLNFFTGDFKSKQFEKNYEGFLKALDEMEDQLPRLENLAARGVEVCQTLITQVQAKKTPSKTLLNELNALDQKLTAFSLTEVLSLSLQKVIQEVTDGLEESLQKTDRKTPETHSLNTLRYSLNLYQGILESARFNLTQAKKARIYGESLRKKTEKAAH